MTSTTSIDFVRTLRETTAILTEDEAQHVRDQLKEVTQILAGIEGQESSYMAKAERPWRAKLLTPIAALASKEEILRAEHNHLLAESGLKPRGIPAPSALIRAAEANLTAEAAGARIDTETRMLLTAPWATAWVDKPGVAGPLATPASATLHPQPPPPQPSQRQLPPPLPPAKRG